MREYIVIENILKNDLFRRLFPPLAGVVFIGAFVSLGFWQLDRAAQKQRLLEQFANTEEHVELTGALPEALFTPIKASGRYLPERQILIDNIVRDGRVGHYVISFLEQAGDTPLLMVNRGWLPRDDNADLKALLDISNEVRTVRGKSGELPHVTIRAGEGFAGAGEWPKRATYPTLEEVQHEIDQAVLPVVLLLDANEPDGYLRVWQPRQKGPMTNYSYAFQWFAMAAAVLAILVWHLRKRSAAS